ncbi:helix-turn-helix transcriptional regulator [Humibacter albus]|jgi:DNA-binding NarL/FixJ family response regulator|uniref:helix-turn-helix transcriptional regulator n=1 Tax=Humibacter albus TaxID=427754 RepID=UPI0003B6FC50|nr:response regulator transcription factor [Humibacter albus]
MAVTLALVNDYEVVVQGLASMLRAYEGRVHVVELDMEQAVSVPVDIALYDTFAAPQGDQAQLHDLAADPMVGKAVVYSWNMDASLVEAALANGAQGYISKGLPASQLVLALEEIRAGTGRIYPAAGRDLTSAGDWPGRHEGLTQREAEVLSLITQGLSNAEIADRTHLSINTVKSYIRSGYRRIGVDNRTQAVLWGVSHGFLPDRGRITRAYTESP